MAILREWRALVRRELAGEYADYVRRTGLAAYRSTSGNMWAAVAIREVNARSSEIVTLSLWRSFEAIKSFTGNDVSHARYFPDDDRYLLSKPEAVLHYECEYLAGAPNEC